VRRRHCISRARFLPWTTIGIRASAVVMMVELRELVVLTAVAGHRLPHCWRDGCEQERDCSIWSLLVSGGEGHGLAGLGGGGIWFVPGDGDQRQAQVAHPLEQAVQGGLVDDGAVDGGGAVAAGGEGQPVEPGGPAVVEVSLEADFVVSGSVGGRYLVHRAPFAATYPDGISGLFAGVIER